MHRFLLPIVLLVVANIGVIGRAAEPKQLRVLSYNIHHAEGVDGKLDVQRIANVIRSVSPDVVAVQEVDRQTQRVKGIDLPAELARLTEMQVAFDRNIAFEGGDYGNAVLSKFKIVDYENLHLPSHGSGEQRGLLMCELEWDALSEPLLFWCTHLDHRRDDSERLESVKVINQLVGERDDRPAILAGDLNATPDSRVLAELRKQWRVANPEPMFTIPVDKPTRQIDFVLARPTQRWKTVEVRVLDEAIASDHRAILAVLELQ